MKAILFIALGMMVMSSYAAEPRPTTEAQQSPQLTGSWLATTIIEQPPGYPDFKDAFTFFSGGTMLESHPPYVPYHPLGAVLYTPGHGAWKLSGPNQYIASFTFFAQGAPGHVTSPGQLLAINRVNYTLTIDKQSDTLNGEWKSRLTDTSDNILFEATGSMSAKRISAEAAF